MMNLKGTFLPANTLNGQVYLIPHVGFVTGEQITQAVADYMADHPASGGSGGGLAQTEKDLILTLFRNAAYTSANMGNTLTQLEALWSGSSEDSGGDIHYHSYTSSVTTAATCTTAGVRTYTCSCGHSYTASIPATGHNYVNGVCTVCGAADPNYSPDEPNVPVEPEVTLTSISATYSGGDVAVGTAVSSLSGIVVTANYSDGSSATVTGYTLSGTIAEGSNTITVSYGGKTATFTVTGIVEQASAWADGYLKDNGSIGQADTFMYYKEYIPVTAGQNCYIANTNPEWTANEAHFAWYDSDKNFIGRTSSLSPFTIKLKGRLAYGYGTIPDNAAFVRGSAANMTSYKDTAIISVEPPELHFPFEDAAWYADTFITGAGETQAEAGCAASDFVSVEPGATYKFGNSNESWSSNWFGIGFYRADGTFISRGAAAQFTTPSGAKYVRLSATGMTGYTETATLTKVS